MVLQFFAGSELAAADLNSLLGFMPQETLKNSTTSRQSTTTYAIDPDLGGIPLGVGSWEIEFMLFFTLSGVTTSKIKTQWQFTGTWQQPIRMCFGPGSGNTGGPGAIDTVNMGAVDASDQDAVYDYSTSGSYAGVREIGNTTVTAAGTLGLYWAQAVSSANNTTLRAGSWCRVRQRNE